MCLGHERKTPVLQPRGKALDRDVLVMFSYSEKIRVWFAPCLLCLGQIHSLPLWSAVRCF